MPRGPGGRAAGPAAGPRGGPWRAGARLPAGRVEGLAEGGEGSRGDGGAHVGHELLVVPEVVQGAQDRAEHLVAADEVAQVGAAVAAAAGGAATALLDR